MKKNRQFLLIVSKLMCILLFSTTISYTASASAVAEQPKITVKTAKIELSKFFELLQNQSGMRFIFNDEDTHGLSTQGTFEKMTVTQILDRIFKELPLRYQITGGYIVISKENRDKNQPKKTRTVSGRVIDPEGKPMLGVSVVLKGSSIGTTTDQNGDYRLTFTNSPEATLEFSFVGMKRNSVVCGASDRINVTMTEDIAHVDDVVVTGYQTIRKSDAVGAITTIKAEDVLMPSYTSIDQMLQGRVAGMVVSNSSSRVGTNPKIRIRGSATILGNQDPLWVVDGVIQPDPIQIDRNDAMVKDLKEILGNQISWLNPMDIKTITVLKDASATAIYGSKAANGVIVVTTKRGERDHMTINYNGSMTFRARPNYGQFNLMNSNERIMFSREAYQAGALYESAPIANLHSYEGIMQMLNERKITVNEAENAVNRLANINTDWFDILTRNSFSSQHNVSLSGGNQKMTYNASLGFNDQKGVEKSNNQSNLSTRINLGLQLHPKLHLDVNLSGSVNKTRSYAAGVNPLGYATGTSRSVPAYSEQGDPYYLRQPVLYRYNRNQIDLGYNILNEMNNSYSRNKANALMANLNLQWKVTPWLTYELVGGFNENMKLSESYAGEQTFYIASRYRGYDFGTERYGSERYHAAMLPFGGVLINNEGNVSNWNIQNKININYTFNEIHRFNVLIGTEVIATETRNRNLTSYGYTPERGEKLISPTPPSQIVPIGSDIAPDNWGILNEIYQNAGWGQTTMIDNKFSIFATLAYSLKNRYVFNASLRNDASNRFGQNQNKRFDPTYSFGLSWNAAQEPWFQQLAKVINQFNVRATYGVQGNVVNSISPDLIVSQGGIKPYYGEYMVNISQLPNPNLSWERTKTYNFGVDIQLLNWITMNFEYYKKRSNNIIGQRIAAEYGIRTMAINGGRIENSGLEYTLNITPIRTQNWGFTIGLNSSKNWNKAKTRSVEQISLNDYLSGSSQIVLKEGYALSSIWSFDYKGLNPTDGSPMFNRIYQMDEQGNYLLDEKGSPITVPFTGDITDYLVYSGTTEPTFTGGIVTRLRYKEFTLGVDFSVLLGAKRRLPNLFPSDLRLPSSETNLDRDLLDRWKSPADNGRTDIPAIYTGRVEEYPMLPNGSSPMSTYAMWSYSNLRVVDGSFLRCNQISLGWNMNPQSCERIGVKRLAVNFTLNNVFVIANKRFNGFDPELGNSVNPKVYSLGINLGF